MRGWILAVRAYVAGRADFRVRLFPHHLDGDTDNFSVPLAEVTGNPLGLKNHSSRRWTGRNPEDSAALDVPPGAILPVRNGLRISFRQAEGEVRLQVG
jgi:hypothetical protein